MNWVDSISLAGTQLLRRRLRAFLCALSVAVGVASMVFIATLGMSGKQEVSRRVTSLGLSGLTVYASQDTAGKPLTAQCATSLQENLPEVTAAMPLKMKSGSYRTTSTSGSAVFLGVTETLGDVMQLQVISGHLPSKRQIQNGEPVAVIDEAMAKTLYARENIVGKKIRFTIDNVEQYYRVIAVIRQQTSALGSFVASMAPSIVYVPYGCVANASESVDQIMVQCLASTDFTENSTKISQFLQTREQITSELHVQNMGALLEQITGLVTLATMLFLIVASISFLVAMIGVLSGMLSATHEKRAEIGLYMALGARKRDIARLFLIQSILVSLTGGSVGMVCSITVLLGISMLLHLTLTMPIAFVLLTLLLSALCGAVAGLLPAMHAAQLRPVEAMH